MCSYMAMFPPRIPYYFIQRFTRPGDRVLDPFSGRGTTPTQACVDGRVGLANDLNPLAYQLSRAKAGRPPLPALWNVSGSSNKIIGLTPVGNMILMSRSAPCSTPIPCSN